MHVFPAEIPAAEARRADVVEVRVARKVAPLFGLDGDIPPFRRSWVCDYTELSLTEIGRGAPSPDRAERSRLDVTRPDRAPGTSSTDGDEPEWMWAGRAVWFRRQSSLSGTLSNATLNRYGPDTKAAAVLTAANRLLRGATAAVSEACRHLAGSGCDEEVRLAVWAGLVLEVYRAQPALVVAAIQARQVQRSLSARWGMQVDRAGVTGTDAPSEVHPPTLGDGDSSVGDGPAARWRPTSFEVVDATLPALGLADDPTTGPGLVTSDALDDIASAWCHRLLGVGRPGRGVVWMTEDARGSRHVHAMVRVGAVVAPFVAACLGASTGGRMAPPTLPTLPDVDVLTAVSVQRRRAYLLTAHLAANYVRYRDELLQDWPQLRASTRDLVSTAVDRCSEVLDADDPVALQLGAYSSYLDVWDLPRTGHDASPVAFDGGTTDNGASGWTPPMRRLVASQERVLRAWRAGHLDPGAAAYLLEVGIVALRDAETTWSLHTEPAGPNTGMTSPASVGAWWSAILEARGLDPGADLAKTIDSLSPAQTFHLHHYAAWLARSGRRGDLRQALTLQERVAAVRAEVTRREPVGFAAKSAAARASHELAAEIATELALATPERERGARVRALEVAVRHARTVLADPSTSGLLRPPVAQPATLRTARVLARAFCTAVANGLSVDTRDAAATVTLLDAVIDNERTDGQTGGGGRNGQDGGDRHGGRRSDTALLATLRVWRTELAGFCDDGRRPS
ncbi:hypothetical protein AB0M91_26730 [Micromonospora rifamycinica]|uniref:hypothetical protein n=1 Tax=Micromonospora rifamycinica TaxID=291594 RepID=UPI00343B338C